MQTQRLGLRPSWTPPTPGAKKMLKQEPVCLAIRGSSCFSLVEILSCYRFESKIIAPLQAESCTDVKMASRAAGGRLSSQAPGKVPPGRAAAGPDARRAAGGALGLHSPACPARLAAHVARA